MFNISPGFDKELLELQIEYYTLKKYELKGLLNASASYVKKSKIVNDLLELDNKLNEAVASYVKKASTRLIDDLGFYVSYCENRIEKNN